LTKERNDKSTRNLKLKIGEELKKKFEKEKPIERKKEKPPC